MAMWILKTAGAGLIVAAGAVSGVAASVALKKRCDMLESIISVIVTIKEQICFFKRELDQIYDYLEQIGTDPALIRMLSSTEDKSSYLDSCSFLTVKDKQLVFELFARLGMSDAKSEEEHILVYIKLIERQLEIARAEFKSKSSLYKSLGFWGGVSLAIFLI